MKLNKTLLFVFEGKDKYVNKAIKEGLIKSIDYDKIVDDFSSSYEDKTNDIYEYDFAFLELVNIVKSINLDEYKEIIAIGFGEGVYLSIALRTMISPKNTKIIAINPVNGPIEKLSQVDYIVYGTNNSFFKEECRDKLKFRYVNLSIIKGANERLETSDEEVNKKIVKDVINEALTTLDSSFYME